MKINLFLCKTAELGLPPPHCWSVPARWLALFTHAVYSIITDIQITITCHCEGHHWLHSFLDFYITRYTPQMPLITPSLLWVTMATKIHRLQQDLTSLSILSDHTFRLYYPKRKLVVTALHTSDNNSTDNSTLSGSQWPLRLWSYTNKKTQRGRGKVDTFLPCNWKKTWTKTIQWKKHS